MPQLGWIDFSPTHRDRVSAALDLLRPEGMVDELGLGTLRDGIANQLFPGISTVQTKAKYFFIIPYILYDFQQLLRSGQAKGRNPSKYLEQREYELMWQLAAHYNYQDNFGVIGITKRKPQKIARRPSVIYWNGLNLYKFIESNGLSCEVFLQKVVKGEFETLLSGLTAGDDSKDDADADYNNVFRIKIFPEGNWAEGLTLDLTPVEADFFYHRIISEAKGRLIAHLLLDDRAWKLAESAESFNEFVRAVVPFVKDSALKNQLILAHDFSEFVYGAHIAYNCLLQKNAFQQNTFEDNWDEWINNIRTNMFAYDNFDLDRILSYTAHPRKGTIAFIKNWWDLINENPNDKSKRNALIEEQEFHVKRSKARLRYKKFDDVKEDKWVGLTYFEYRFRSARPILNDIKTGMAG